MVASLETPELPRLTERLPEIANLARATAGKLLDSKFSPLIAVEPIYEYLHGLKGILNLVISTPQEKEFVLSTCKAFGDFCHGKSIIGERTNLINFLDQLAKKNFFTPLHQNIFQESSEELPDLPFSMPYTDHRAQVRWKEAIRLKYYVSEIEQKLALQDIPIFRQALLATIASSTEDLGFIVHAIPYLIPEAGQEIRYWACIAIPPEFSEVFSSRYKRLKI